MYPEALEQYQKVLQMFPDDFMIYSSLGKLYLLKEDGEKAMVAFQRSLEINPKQAEPLFFIGVLYAYLLKGQWGNAVKDYTDSIKIDPHYVVAYYGRAYAYDKKGDFKKALRDYEKSVEIDPSYEQKTRDRIQAIKRVSGKR